MAIRTVAAPLAAIVARGRGLDLPSWRRMLGVIALVVLVALAVGARIELRSARRELAHTRAVGSAAREDVRGQRSLVSATELTLEVARTDEAVAATEVEEARTVLAATGVEEEELLRVRDETKGALDDIEAQRTMADALRHQQELDLPTAKECVLEGNRGLMRASSAAPCTVAPFAPTAVK